MARYNRYAIYLTDCVSCGGKTNKAYARANSGKCKSCVTGVEQRTGDNRYKCPDCDGPLSAYQHAHHYHCDACTREADPDGYANEVRGYGGYDGE